MHSIRRYIRINFVLVLAATIFVPVLLFIVSAQDNPASAQAPCCNGVRYSQPRQQSRSSSGLRDTPFSKGRAQGRRHSKLSADTSIFNWEDISIGGDNRTNNANWKGDVTLNAIYAECSMSMKWARSPSLEKSGPENEGSRIWRGLS